MMKRLMRFRVLKERLVLNGVYLPLGDYDGEISDIPSGIGCPVASKSARVTVILDGPHTRLG